MPLSDAHKHLLYEIYEVSYRQTTTITGGGGSAPTPTLFDVAVGVKKQLEDAIAEIDADDSQSARVGAIVAQYEEISTDFSTIDREGYSFRPEKNLSRIRKVLYPYTGIVFSPSGGNRIVLG